MTQTELIPDELKKIEQWAIHIEKRGKIPVQATHPFKNAAVNRPSTFSTFEQCLEQVVIGRAQGLVFVFTKEDKYIGIDIDDCINQGGELSQKAEELIKSINTYTEISKSGGGLHLIGKVKDKSFMRAVKEKGFEFYPFNRAFIMTGNIYKDYSQLNDVSDIFINQFKKLDKYHYNPFTEEEPKEVGNDAKHQEGNRNNALFNYAALLRRAGLGEKIIFESCKTYNINYCVPPLKDREIRQITKSILRYPISQLLPAKMAQVRAEQKETEDKGTWTDPAGYIRNASGKIKQGIINTTLLLKNNSNSWKIQWDEFKDVVYVNETEFNENVLNDVGAWLESTTSTCPWPTTTAYSCILNLATESVINPLKDYLKKIQWDGIERLSYIPSDVFHVDGNEYHKKVVTTFFVQAVNRAFNPGCQADGILLLIGPQGCGKSSFCKELVPEKEWYLDYFLSNIHDKDGSMALVGKWIVEMSELSGLTKSTIESIKAFLTRQIDEYRPPYARMVVKRPRTSIFVGTTNDETPLKDVTGNRRYWPIFLSKELIDLENVKTNRDQYWAEAVSLYKNGYPTWYQDEFSLREQERAIENDAIEDYLNAAFSRMPPKNELTLPEIGELLELKPRDVNKSIQTRIGFAMKNLGYKRVSTVTREGNKLKKQYKWVLG